ncbi:hypothetical protein FGO68_gene4849 [Halteria grandinella]|uniref:Phosphatidylinositol-glycan biosynthesis class W protein n=1 Tax=Halteria grandinella TaxID=5974 RepID=A0A8J8NDR5_HALGN|nr:hypothetical protein FGO68_gene4849 [Halteria grandinella]
MIDESPIVRPFWIGNERKAYNVIANKKIIHLIKGEKKGEEKEKPENVIINIQFITNQRALLLVATVVSILAVDFPLIFPRRLCKTEEFGISLMDVGVGSVMFSSGLTQRKIRDLVLSKEVQSTIMKDLLALFKGSFFIFLLAFGRFILHREIDYHSHVTEWGVHWNFYATIYVVNLALVLLQNYLKWSLPIALALMVAYEFAIVRFGLREYVFYGPRTDWVSANREGIVSSVGYLAVCLVGIEFGRSIYRYIYEESPNQSEEEREMTQRDREVRLFNKMIGLCMMFWGAFFLSEDVFDKSSRRLCNMAYVIWMVCLNLTDLLLFYFTDRIMPRYETNLVIEAINYNQLFYFFFSSLMTGLVNLLVWTLYEDAIPSYGYMFIYLYGVAMIVVVLKALRLRIKI